MDAKIQLRAIADIVRVIDVEIWLRGGWAMDFFLGEVTRPHRDIDFFCQASDAERIVGSLRVLGYRESAGPPPDLQRDLLGPGELQVQVALLGRDSDGCPTVPGGPHAGARWPADLLDGPVGRIGDVTCRIVSPRAQIEIKMMMPIWLPGMPRRAKDTEDIARLQAALTPDPIRDQAKPARTPLGATDWPAATSPPTQPAHTTVWPINRDQPTTTTSPPPTGPPSR